MARWQRDPRIRKRLAYLLVLVEVLAVTACFYGIFSAYFLRGLLFLGVERSTAYLATRIGAWVGTALALAGVIVVGLKYLGGRAWPRRAFLATNAVLVGLGLLWFVVHQARAEASTDNTASLLGLLLPMATLFPLLWPLLKFRPVGSGGESGA